MDNTTTMYIVIGLLAVFFLVFLIFSAKTWRVLHMLSAFFVFVSAGFLVWFAAATLKTTTTWRHAVTELTTKVAAEEEATRKLIEGTRTEDTRPAIPGSPFEEIEHIEDSIQDVRAALERTLLDRGRVWRRTTAVVNNPGAEVPQITITIPATDAPAVEPPAEEPPPEEPPAGEEPPPGEEPPAGEDPPAEEEPPAEPAPAVPAGAHAIAANTILYGFAEGESQLSGELGVPGFGIPQLYLGEFRVLDRTNSTITVQPTIPLTPLQNANLEASTWTLYDTMPVDKANAYAGLSEDDLRILLPRENLSMSQAQYEQEIARLATYFDGMTPGELSTKVPMSRVTMSDAEYDAFIQSILRTGKEAGDQTDLNRVWYRVEFKAPTILQVDAVPQLVGPESAKLNFEYFDVVAVKRSEGDVVIGQSSLIVDKPGDANLGQVRLGLTVLDRLKQVPDASIESLWEVPPTIPYDPNKLPKLHPLTEIAPEQLTEVLEAKSIEFDLGDTTIVDARTAKFLLGPPPADPPPEWPISVEGPVASEAIVKIADVPDLPSTIYVRPLREYATYFNDDYRFDLQFEDEAGIIKQDTDTLNAANAKALEQVTYRADEIAKLQADKEGFNREAAAIAKVLEDIEARRQAVRARLSKLYTDNLQLAERIRVMQVELVNAARRSAEAGAEADADESAPPSETRGTGRPSESDLLPATASLP